MLRFVCLLSLLACLSVTSVAHAAVDPLKHDAQLIQQLDATYTKKNQVSKAQQIAVSKRLWKPIARCVPAINKTIPDYMNGVVLRPDFIHVKGVRPDNRALQGFELAYIEAFDLLRGMTRLTPAVLPALDELPLQTETFASYRTVQHAAYDSLMIKPPNFCRFYREWASTGLFFWSRPASYKNWAIKRELYASIIAQQHTAYLAARHALRQYYPDQKRFLYDGLAAAANVALYYIPDEPAAAMLDRIMATH